MIGVLAARRRPACSASWCSSARRPATSTTTDYVGGFSAQQIEELLQFLESNHMGWSTQMAPAIMGNPDRPELGEELTNSFCRTDPEIAKAFARVTFTSDNRTGSAGRRLFRPWSSSAARTSSRPRRSASSSTATFRTAG